MALTKNRRKESVLLLDNGSVKITYREEILEDGVVIFQDRKVVFYTPDDDMTQEDSDVISATDTYRTSERLEKWRLEKEEDARQQDTRDGEIIMEQPKGR